MQWSLSANPLSVTTTSIPPGSWLSADAPCQPPSLPYLPFERSPRKEPFHLYSAPYCTFNYPWQTPLPTTPFVPSPVQQPFMHVPVTCERESLGTSMDNTLLTYVVYYPWNEARLKSVVHCSAMRAPSLFRVMVAHGPIPPVQDITNGAKEACSISRTLRSYTLRFSFSWRL